MKNKGGDLFKTHYQLELMVKSSSLICLVTCPSCLKSFEEIMPERFCKIQSNCKICNKTINAKLGDCCIYCSYGSKKCPSMQ